MADDARPVSQGAAVQAPPITETAPRSNTRKRLFAYLGAGVAVVAVLAALQWVLIGSHYVSTEDAYVGASTARISAQVAGVIAEVPISETRPVKAGETLLVIDPADAKLAQARAEAEYRRAIQHVRQFYAEEAGASAQVAARQADLVRAETDFDRRSTLAQTGAVSGEELSSARAARDAAKANLAAAQQMLASQRALTQGTRVDTNPETLAAKAALDAANLNLSRTKVVSPIDGIVVQNATQIGQRVEPGTPLMSIAPISDAYVDANFKEGQLRKMRIGQPVELKSDVYGGRVKYHGIVTGIGGGTGSAFAVIPAQNATGNWIKVIQRVPVRIKLQREELAKNPLRVGMSMHATVNVSK